MHGLQSPRHFARRYGIGTSSSVRPLHSGAISLVPGIEDTHAVRIPLKGFRAIYTEEKWLLPETNATDSCCRLVSPHCVAPIEYHRTDQTALTVHSFGLGSGGTEGVMSEML